MKTFRFLEFPVYKAAKALFREIVRICRQLPREHWELADQMRRCSLSICLNVAEGSAKRSDKDFNRYIENSLGSVNELVACLDIAQAEKLIEVELFRHLSEQAENIAKQLGGLSRRLRSS